jgi:Tfp pilus assembly protein PilP
MSTLAKTNIHYREFITYTSLLVTISLCSLCCLSGCKDKTAVTPAATSITKKSNSVNSKKVKDFHARLKHLLEPVTNSYSSDGKPDPFQPFLKTAQEVSERPAGTPGMCANPLECMDIAQLTLVGIIGNDKNNRVAMAQDAAGIGYLLQPGMRVGYRNGRVKKILSDRVIVEEKFEDIRGELILQKRVLLLYPEGK